MTYRGQNPELDKQADKFIKRTLDYLSKTPEQRKKENEDYKKKVEYYKNNKEANDKRKISVKELQKATESAQNTNNTFIPLEDSNGRTQSELYRIKENNQATNSRTRSELYRAKENIKEANRKDSFGKWLGKQAMAGVDAFNKGIAATADFILPTEILGKYDFVSNINDYYNKSYNNRVSAAQRSSASRGKGWKTAGDLVSGTIAALPNAGISLMTAGLSGAANGISSLGTAASSASKFGNTANAVKDTVKTMVKNPMYWTSAAQTLGTDYEEAKERGANDLIATAAAIITTALNAGIEVGGGIETLPQNIKSGGRKAILEWVKSAFEEGGEEVLQSITSNAAAKLLYDRSAPIYSTKEDTAVINPIALAKDFGMGAAVGGILGAGQVGVMNAVNTAQITKTGKDLNSPDIVQAMIDTGLESPKNTESYNLAKKAQSKKGKLSDYEVGKLYYANAAQIEQEEQNTQSQTVNNYGENTQSQTVNNNGQNNQNQTVNNGQNNKNQTVNNNGQNTAKKADVVSWYDPSSDKIIAKSSAEAKNVIGVLAQKYPEVTINEMEKQIVHDETKKVLQEYINIGLGDEPLGKYFTDSLEVNTKVDTYNNTNVNTDSYSNVNAENNFNNTANTVQNDIPKAADFNPDIATKMIKSHGENGAKAFDTALQNERAKGNNISRYDFLRYFNKYYAAALVGKSKSTVDVNYSDRISQSSAMAAYTAGVKDKALELEKKIKAANNVTRQNGGVLINENSRLINNDTVSYINGVAKDLGVSVEFVDSVKSQGGQSVNGSYSDGTMKISMEVLNNPNVETDEVRNMVAESIFKHGITHRIQHLAPKQFERFRDLVYEYVSSKNSSNLTEVEKQLLKEYEGGVDMNYSEAVDEIVADFVGSADFAKHVAVKDKNLAQKILDVIRDILDKIGVKKYSEMDNIARAWEKAVNAAEKNVNKANIGTFDKSNPDIRYSTKNANELIENAEKASANTGKITKDMPDEERSKIISQKRITVPTYNKDKFDVIKDFDINILKETYKGKAHSIVKNIDKNFNITNKMYSNKDIELDFEYSKSSLKESVNKQNKNYDDFAKMLSVFDDVVTNAVGIEVHDDKYKGTLREDTALQNMYVLASAFKDGDRIIPVQLEIKNYNDRANKLYLTVTIDENQRNNDVSTSLGQNQLHNGITVPSDISISDLVKSVNASNGKFLKYFPDSMLNSEQISAKQEALKADEERINQYRNGERPSYSSENSDDLVKKIQADLDILNKKYGSFEPGENAARDVRIPKQTTDTDYTRRYARTAAEAEALTDDQSGNLLKAVRNGTFSYSPIDDINAKERADKAIVTMGYDEAMKQWQGVVNSNKNVSKYDIALGERLLQIAAQKGDTKTVVRLTGEIAAEGTRAGQVVQAMRLLKKMDGVGQLMYIENVVKNLQKDLIKMHGKKAPTIKVDEKLSENLAKAKSPEAVDRAVDDIITNIADQVPATWLDKWNAWRFLSMLGNPRTHIRNIVGNVVFAPAVATKNIISTVLEIGVDTTSKVTRKKGIERSKALHIPKRYKNFAKTDFEQMESILTSGGKLNITDMVKERQKIFKIKPLEKMRVLNGNLLEAEDRIFLKSHYVHALGSYLAANKIDIDTLTLNNEEGYKALERARAYAIKEAQKATYRDASSFATALNNLSRTNKATHIAIEALLPFKKTPVNILKRGIEYSPLGLIDTITRGTYKLAKKQYTASEFIDGLSSGLTGTGIVALGLWMASLGLLRGSSKDDKEEFEEMEGAQTYAVYSGNKSYTIDWAAPACIPLFIGAELYRLTENDEKLNVSTVIDSLATLSEPIFEMSMLDGLNSVFEAPSKNPDDKEIVAITREMVTSYLGQAVPTLLGQTTRTFFDDTRRRSYADKNSSIPTWAQYAYQKQANKIPGLSKKQEPYIDNWGREQKTGNIYERAFENYFSPGYYSEENLSDVDIELMRLAEQATEDRNVFPKKAVKYFDVDKVRKDLTAKEYTTYQTVKGQKSYELISDIYNGEAYDDLTDEQRIEAITKLYEVADVVGKKSVSDYVSTKNWIEEAIDKGDSAIIAAAILKTCGPDYASTNGMYTALDNGVDMGTYIEFLNKTNGVKADKDKNGKTIKNSKQDKIKKILQDMDATDEEKAYLFNSEYENSKNNPWKAYLK